MRRLFIALPLLAAALAGCGDRGEVTAADAAKNEKEFSREAYEEAMRKSGRGAELEEQRRREALREQGQ